ncbi:Ig-like domain-containing protein [Pseudomonas akapageensis]|uniref:Ig-like domain-containing protein n=1 Tax=Pseudomonas akapageensis TaxID=2609961 RepID=UPI001409825D|nr:Ig-like domain-containing protein [Pseudomonas akapageensis]
MNKWPRLALSALGLSLSMAGAAHAGLKAVDPGPYTAANGHFPMWYQDDNDQKLELCQSKAISPNVAPTTPPSYLCTLAVAPGVYDDTVPMVFPDNFPDEGFWFMAQAAIPAVGGMELEIYTAAVEAAFSTPAPANGGQIAFARIRMRITVPSAGTYTVTHPYGFDTFNVTTPGRRAINITRDIGIGAPGDYTGALKGEIGPFLQSVNGPYHATNPETGVVETFIGDPNLSEAVTGSPKGTNYIEIQGPGPNGPKIRTDLFTVTGKLFDDRKQTPLEVERATYRRTGAGTQVEVFGKAPNNSSLCFRETLALLPGATPACLIPMDTNNNGLYFAQHNFNGAAPQLVVVTASDLLPPANPLSTKPTSLSSKLIDVVKIQTARYDWNNHRLTIEAASSDEVDVPVLVAEGFGRLSTSGTGQQLTVNDLPQPPATLTVKSSAGGVDTEPVTVVGNAPEGPGDGVPRTTADSATTTQGAPVTIDVLANDTALNGNTPLTVTDLTQPAAGQGTVALSGTTAVIFTPPAVVTAPFTATFTYRAMDSTGVKSTVTTVNVAVTPPPNQAPVAGNDVATTTTGAAPITLNVLANDTDPDGNVPLTVVGLTQPAAGRGTATTNGTTVVFTPGTTAGTATFTYQVRDSLGALSAPATITVTVTAPVNQPPVANNDTGATQTTAIALNVLANDTDPDGNTPLTVVNLTQPPAGQGTVTTNGTTVTYTPPAGLQNAISASFTYRARDSRGALSAPATVTVQVTPVANVENLSVTAATVTLKSGNRFTWDISGTAGTTAGNTITVQATTPNGLVTLGTTNVPVSGRWRLVANNSSIAPSAAPTVTARSAAGNTVTASVTVQ